MGRAGALGGLRLAACAVLAFACGGGDPTDAGPRPDAGPGRGGQCEVDSDCDDGRFCNGEEVCISGLCGPGSAPDCDDGVACTRDRCVESMDACVSVAPDLDFDGHADAACGGDDCDDADPLRFTGALEVCDAAGRDEDCDPDTFGSRDADGDGAIDARCCNGDRCGTDCDDMQPAAHPSQPEACDGIDNDCDASVDEGVLGAFYADADGDGFALESAAPESACFAPVGFVPRRGDCDDADAQANPGLPEVCDAEGRDDDCDGDANPASQCSCTGSETRPCQDGDGAPLSGRCAAGVERCSAGTFTACTVPPDNETCDGVDEDCDGRVDEGWRIACWPDFDNDGFAAEGTELLEVCPAPGRTGVGGCPGGTTNRDPSEASDCDDRSGSARPTATERPANEADDDCDGRVDEA
ncbi:MAG: putative metal-binding motif-containing protein [Sandaracinaceae bacterium]